MTDKQKYTVQNMRRMGLAYSVIAHNTGLSANTVKSFCHRAGVAISNDFGNENCNVCKNCGIELNHHPGRKKKRFCTNKCRSDWWNRNRDWAYYKRARQVVCLYCGMAFDSYGSKNRKFCGRDCYIRSRYGEGLP